MRDRSSLSDPSVDCFYRTHSTEKASRLLGWMSSFLRVWMYESRCEEVFRASTCPRCQKRFYICRHCDRGHLYCCKECFLASRCEKCRLYRRVYRQSPKGQEDHRERERSRRRRRTLLEKSVGDQGYEEVSESATVAARVRMAAVVAVLSGARGEETADEYVYCEMCGRRARFIYFGDGTTRQWNRRRVFRYSG